MKKLCVTLVLLFAIGLGAGIAAETTQSCCEPGECRCKCGCGNCGSQGCSPKGGLTPYGGGLLNWWPRCCFPSCGAPDDYCRKPLPCVCWPAYPNYFQFGPPDACCVERECGK